MLGLTQMCKVNFFNYSESQIYEYIARVFYNVVFSTYLGSMPRKNEFNNCFPTYFRAINLPWIKNNKQFFKNYLKTYDSTMLFGYIFINRIQPFEAANISAAFFLCRPMRKHNRCHTFQNKFQDDISCTLAMYSYIWDSL